MLMDGLDNRRAPQSEAYSFGYATDEQRAMASAIDELCGRHASAPEVARWDRDETYPVAAMAALAEAGWAGLAVPPLYTGSGGSTMDLVVVHRALARHSLALAQAYYSLWVLGAEAISRLGTEEQRVEWLPRIADGTALVAFALTEPEAGSDATALRTTASQDGEDFVINGQKVFITGAAVADVIVTAVRTDSTTEERRDGISLLMIDPKTEGVVLRPLSKLGLKAIDLCEVFFDDVRVPVDRVLGPLHAGWSSLKPGLARERLLLAAISAGANAQVLELACEHARQRQAFGRSIGEFQLVLDKLVEMRIALETADLLTCRAARRIDDGLSATVEASMAKLHATRSYVSATREGVQVFGGYGFVNEYPIARHYRDAKYLEIGGGSSEIQKLIIGRSMGLG